MPKIIISYPNPDSFECDIKIEKGMEGQVGSIFAVVAHKLNTCSNMDLLDMKSLSVLNHEIIIGVEGVKIDVKWNNLELTQLRAIGEVLRVQAFKMWMIPVMPSKVVLPNNPYQFRS